MTAQVRFFKVEDLMAAISFADQGGIAIHDERRRDDVPAIWARVQGRAYRVIGSQDNLREWGSEHAQWSWLLRELGQAPGLWYYFVAGAAARHIEQELKLDFVPGPAGPEWISTLA